MSRGSKAGSVVTIILLILTFVFYPFGIAGLVSMWLWTKWPTWLKILITIPFAILLLLFLLSISLLATYIFLFRPYQMSGQSMNPTYKDGAYIMTRITKSPEKTIDRGDIVIFKSPIKPDTDNMKRVVGLPRDTIMIKEGNVYLNGQKLDESSYLEPNALTYPQTFLSEGQIITVPVNEYFVLGDNRPYSQDSREWGFIKKENIISEVSFCYWKCD